MADNKRYNFGKKCVCVGRVSTYQQSQTAQVTELETYAKSLGFESVKMFFTTESGFLDYDSKQGWNLVVSFFKDNPDYKVLICSEISRLSRKESILHTIKQYLIDNNIQLIIKDINYTLFNEFGELPKGNELVFSLYASLADSEMRQKRERFKRGLTDNRRLGYSIGGKRLFGYDRIYEEKDGKKRSKYIINKQEAQQIIDVYKWYAFGIDNDLTQTSLLTITRKCIEQGYSHYLHSKRNVNKCLKEKAYLGVKETHNKTKNPAYWNYKKQDAPKYIDANTYTCIYPPIFVGDNIALFDLVQNRLKRNNSKLGSTNAEIDKSTKHTTILSKLLRCPCCGLYLHGEYRERLDYRRPHLGKRPIRVYRCTNSRGAINECDFKHVMSMQLLDSVVWSFCEKGIIWNNWTQKRNDREKAEKEIDDKIKNLRDSISSFNIESKLKAEDAILRNKMKTLTSEEAQRKAILNYEAHTNNIQKELKNIESRILELEQNKKRLSHLYNRHIIDNISSNRKELHYYIHQFVDNIDILFCDKQYTILHVHLKEAPFLFYLLLDGYILIEKKSQRHITAYTIVKRDFEHAILWNNENRTFEVGERSVAATELFDYINQNVGNQGREINETTLPFDMHALECKRLVCYDED